MIEYHVLFVEKGGGVQSCFIQADSIEDCERKIQSLYPLAVYWEIGF